jgi:hypothetical protein
LGYSWYKSEEQKEEKRRDRRTKYKNASKKNMEIENQYKFASTMQQPSSCALDKI